jgi:probable HAF family extracellular repeat protein
MKSLSGCATRSSYVDHGEAFSPRSIGLSRFTPLLILCAGLALIPARSEAAYAATELASLPQGYSRVVRGLNDGGEFTGGRVIAGRQRAFLRTGGALQDFDGLPNSDFSVAYGINNTGETVGLANIATGMRAFRSRRVIGAVALDPLPGDSSSAAFDINHPGTAVGFSSGPSGIRAVTWSRTGAIQALPALPGTNSNQGRAISDSGTVAGVSDTAAGPRAVQWVGGVVQDLGALPGHSTSEALGINNSGEIVGYSGDPNGQHHAVLWSAGGSAIDDLGVLPGGISSRALDVNNRTEVVGTSHSSAGNRAFLWTRGAGMQDLNDLLTARAGFVLTSAVAINAPGVILAIGQDEVAGEDGPAHEHELPTRIFQLVPVP